MYPSGWGYTSSLRRSWVRIYIMTHGVLVYAHDRYHMNQNYVARVKEEIDKVLKIRLIRPVKQETWLSPIVVVPKKNGKIRVWVDYRKLNAIPIIDAFPLPFTDSVLNAIAAYDMYSFLDGFYCSVYS